VVIDINLCLRLTLPIEVNLSIIGGFMK
ncbi:uncharacterized protein METZ01_LOCUS318706, partial [marine metagenome]